MAANVIRLQPIDMCFEDIVEPTTMLPDTRDQLTAMFKALGDATRLEIFRLIAAQTQPICACQMVDRFNVSQPTIAHHLKVLRNAGLVTATKHSVWVYFSVSPHATSLLADMATTFVPAVHSGVSA